MTRATIFGNASPVMTNSADATTGNFGTAFYITSGSNWKVKGARIFLTDPTAGTTGFIAYLLQGTALNSATVLATANFGTMSINAWNEVLFSSPVAISVGNKYWVMVYCPSGKYSYIAHQFDNALQSVENPSLYGAGTAEVSPGNGGYSYGSAGNMASASFFNNTFYGVDVIADNGVSGVTVPPNLDLANSQRAYWLATVTTGGSLSNLDLYKAFLQVKTGKTNMSIPDMEKIYWNGIAGTSNMSVQGAKRIAFAPYQFEELYWLRAQP